MAEHEDTSERWWRSQWNVDLFYYNPKHKSYFPSRRRLLARSLSACFVISVVLKKPRELFVENSSPLDAMCRCKKLFRNIFIRKLEYWTRNFISWFVSCFVCLVQVRSVNLSFVLMWILNCFCTLIAISPTFYPIFLLDCLCLRSFDLCRKNARFESVLIVCIVAKRSAVDCHCELHVSNNHCIVSLWAFAFLSLIRWNLVSCGCVFLLIIFLIRESSTELVRFLTNIKRDSEQKLLFIYELL